MKRCCAATDCPPNGDLARYVFFTTTGQQLDDARVDEARFYLGESRLYEVYMLYKPRPGVSA